MSDAWARLTARLFAQNQFSMKLGLDRMHAALAATGLTPTAFRVATVAGTNGKGTTSSLLAALLQDAGLRVGLYTSPHLVDVCERFRLDGAPAPREAVAPPLAAALAVFGGALDDDPELLQQGAEAAEALGWPPPGAVPFEQRLTFFELTTLAALAIFQRAAIDVAVLEIGLGGRLDAVNAVEPDLALITAIDLDHQEHLGATRAAIAAEKAGTLRRGRPAIFAPQGEEAAQALHAAASALQIVPVEPRPDDLRDLPTWLTPPFDANVACAHAAAQILLGAPISHTSLRATLERYQWPGRRQDLTLGAAPDLRGRWVLDAAHNPGGAASLVRWLDDTSLRPAAAVFGAMADKDIAGVLDLLAPCAPTWITTAVASPRAAHPDALAALLIARGADAEAAPEPRLALARARARAAHPDAPILVCGSIYLLGEVLAALEAPDAFFSIWRPPLC